MKTRKISLLLIFVFVTGVFIACNQNPTASNQDLASKSQDTSASKISADTTKEKYTKEMIDNKKDPSCGMPLNSGIDDTVHYNGKVYGFCSKECKDDFLKNPAAMAKATEMK